MAVFMIFMFVVMFMFGGIAVDVMRFETRRVALQQTMDRAALAAASLTQTRNGCVIANEWFDKTDLGQDLEMVRFTDPTCSTVNDAGLRRVTIRSDVRSYNYFMGKFYNDGTRDISYLEGPALSQAAQGVSDIEVMLVLDITGSMGERATPTDPKTKIQGMREAAAEFVNIVKGNDSKNGISIGVVPYAAQVNVPADLRAQFNELNLSTWDGIANAGVPDINCVEFPTASFGSTGYSITAPIRMAAVADAKTDTVPPTTAGNNPTDFVTPANGAPNIGNRACTTNVETAATAWVDADVNKVLLPTKNVQPVLDKVSRLTAQGNTYIAVGMRWGTALLDEAAKPIYTAIGDSTVQGRPDMNNSVRTRKIIILMTDGEHVTNNHVYDNFKTGLSPIWRGTDGNFAIRFVSGGPALTGGTKPSNCSGWTIPATRNYFLPHMKDNAENARNTGVTPAQLEGLGTGTRTVGACDPNAWIAAPTWPATVPDGADADDERDVVTVADGPDADLLPDVVMVTATQLDWSEVWRHVRVSWVARQLYVRSGVTGATSFSTVMNQFRGTYLSSVTNMNTLLQQNCTAARNAGIEIYGIAFAAPANGTAQINGCSSSPKENYFFDASDSAKLSAAFRMIAVDISELRLTQ
jgi:Putative Flp pilus-assembly TadE/G-like